MTRALTLLAAALAAAPLPAMAAAVTLALTSGNMLARTQSRAMLVATTGTFRQLSGTLRYDPVTGACDVNVTFVVTSLTLPNAMIRAKTMSPAFLDPAQYPLEHYVATCQGPTLAGQLTMRGQTHAFTMALTYTRTGGVPTAIHAAGTLNRYDWGVSGLPLLVGKNIRVTNDISLASPP